MDIHKRNAAHSWREFLVEIGTIICGILIALGLEQAIEILHQQHLRQEAREAIRGELSVNLDAFRRRGEIQACIEPRLGELERLLVSTPPEAKLPRPLWVGRPQVWAAREDLWLAATSGARTSLLPPEEQASYARIYGSLRDFENEEQREQLAWVHLRALATLPSLDPQSRARLIDALNEARYANFRIKVAASQGADGARELGLRTRRSPFKEGSRSVCIPMNTPRDEAVKIATKGREAYGEP